MAKRVQKFRSALVTESVGQVASFTEDIRKLKVKRGTTMLRHPRKFATAFQVLRYRRYHCAYVCLECGQWHGNGNGRWTDLESPRDHLAQVALTHMVREDNLS